MASLRMQRVRELLRREIGEAIRREFQVSEAGLITVNDVDVTGDLHSAVVFISILANADRKRRGFSLLVRRPHPPKIRVPRSGPGFSETAAWPEFRLRRRHRCR